MARRVVISGLGVVSPLGNDITTFFERLMAGQSGIRKLQLPFLDKLSTRIGAQVLDFDPSAHFNKMQLTGMERFSQFALVAAAQAIADAQLELSETEQPRAGICMGSCMGGASTLEDGYTEVMQRDTPRVKPLSVLLSMNNAAASHISIKYGLQGPNVTYCYCLLLLRHCHWRSLPPDQTRLLRRDAGGRLGSDADARRNESMGSLTHPGKRR